MRSGRTIRSVAVLASAALVLGALVAAPAAAGKKKCARYAPAAPQSNADTAAEAPSAKVLKVTARATEAKPVTVELDQGPGFWIYDAELHQTPVIDSTQFVNVQVVGANKGLYIRQEWATPSISDLDLYMYDVTGAEVGGSGAFNPAPLPVISSQTGGMGYEQVSGFDAPNCTGFTIESRSYATTGETVTLKFWLGDIQPQE